VSRHVVIVGGGIVGLCCAYYCALRGWRVTVVERGGPERDGCSFGNAGLVVPSHIVPLAAPGMVQLGLKWMLQPEAPFHVRPRLSWDLLRWGWHFCRAATPSRVRRAGPVLRDLSLASRRCYEELAAAIPEGFGLTPNGLLMLCKTEHALQEERKAADEARRLGLNAEVVDARRIAELEPDIRIDALGGVLFSQDCHLQPLRLMQGLQDLLVKYGVEFRWNTTVHDWRTRGRRIVGLDTSQGEVAGNDVVLAGGSWSSGLARRLALDVPMQPGKGYSLTLPRPRQMPRRGLICVEARLAVTPLGDAVRFGGTMELGGLDESVSAARVNGILRSIPKYFPEFHEDDFGAIKPWCGLRPCSPDGLPYLGRVPRWDNLVVATGHAMLGVSLGPITGEIVAELLAGEQPSVDLRLLRPERFALAV
jgi:D-amino-acid dehydrogenase